jgi:hypothetical protein
VIDKSKTYGLGESYFIGLLSDFSTQKIIFFPQSDFCGEIFVGGTNEINLFIPGMSLLFLYPLKIAKKYFLCLKGGLLVDSIIG